MGAGERGCVCVLGVNASAAVHLQLRRVQRWHASGKAGCVLRTEQHKCAVLYALPWTAQLPIVLFCALSKQLLVTSHSGCVSACPAPALLCAY
jgi:hypothetical protein